ncbi:PEP-utilizing enzyme [uncultured Marinobacter sp.]|uniref:PEP-utilizing enzyme n=1 Tax=uncultured Marinobacter sp. TaxID=187379 RepID=UPI0030D9930A|tara:strand:+ start:24763 stop:25164 length:402 start_codon:yes stop_codon:yes gene_type:complete
MSNEEVKDIDGYRFIGQGYNVVTVGRQKGVALNVNDPKQMIALMSNSQKVKETVVITPGGTTTFVAPLLYKKPAGIITYAGTPESHLGIVGRNFRVPIVMTLTLEGCDSIPDGTPMLMECDGKLGRVYAKLPE